MDIDEYTKMWIPDREEIRQLYIDEFGEDRYLIFKIKFTEEFEIESDSK